MWVKSSQSFAQNYPTTSHLIKRTSQSPSSLPQAPIVWPYYVSFALLTPFLSHQLHCCFSNFPVLFTSGPLHVLFLWLGCYSTRHVPNSLLTSLEFYSCVTLVRPSLVILPEVQFLTPLICFTFLHCIYHQLTYSIFYLLLVYTCLSLPSKMEEDFFTTSLFLHLQSL